MAKKTIKPETRRYDRFFKRMAYNFEALTFQDIRMIPLKSLIVPKDVILRSQLTTNIFLEIPILSAAMDTVTEDPMAIVMAKVGGMGILHRGCSPEIQEQRIERVKFDLNALIEKPICVQETEIINDVLKMLAEKRYKFRSLPVFNNEGKVVGVVAGDNFDMCDDRSKPISSIMSKEVIFGKPGTTPEQAYNLMQKNGKKILPILNRGKLIGLFTFQDVKRIVKNDRHNYSLDKNGRLMVGAAVGVGKDFEERMERISNAGADVVVVDTAHGHSGNVFEKIKICKKKYSHIELIAGNVSTGEAAKDLAKLEVNAIKVGQGPSPICTTRIVAGIGVPQVTALYNVSKALRGSGIPVIADGGIKSSGDMAIALSIANTVMIGNMIAGTAETPGEILKDKNGNLYKIYRGMGSLEAMKNYSGNADRYGQEGVEKLVPEGVVEKIPYKGPVTKVIEQLTGGVRSGCGYLGASNLDELRDVAQFIKMTTNGYAESLPSATGTESASNFE